MEWGCFGVSCIWLYEHSCAYTIQKESVLVFSVSYSINFLVRTQWREGVLMFPVSGYVNSLVRTHFRKGVLMFYLINSFVRTKWREVVFMFPVCVSYSLKKIKFQRVERIEHTHRRRQKSILCTQSILCSKDLSLFCVQKFWFSCAHRIERSLYSVGMSPVCVFYSILYFVCTREWRKVLISPVPYFLNSL